MTYRPFLRALYPYGKEEKHAQSRRSSACALHFQGAHQKPNFVLSVAATTIRLSFIIALCVGLALLGAVIGIAKAFVDTAPTLDLAALDAQDKTSFIYDSEGNLITDYKGTEDRIMVSIDEIPEMLQNAFIAVEDARFYEHNGVDVKRIVARWSPTSPAVPRRAAQPSPSSSSSRPCFPTSNPTSASCRKPIWRWSWKRATQRNRFWKAI